MRDVTFTYPGRRQPALCGVGFAAPAGGTVAIVGPSGAGKSTIAQLLLRFWDPQTGIVGLHGRDARDWTLDALRRRTALVAQDTYLLDRKSVVDGTSGSVRGDLGGRRRIKTKQNT